jgi:hypothetical protein
MRNTWTVGTVLASALSLSSLLSMFAGGIWFAARLDSATKNIPQVMEMEKTDEVNIAILQDQQKYTDMRYAEIMVKLDKIDQKLDEEEKTNEQAKH